MPPLVGLLAMCLVPPAHAAADLFERSIEELGELVVTSVSRRSEPLRDAASAIHVITAEDIRRSGFTSLPEILRLAPGVEVARDGAHSWSISIRGFNSDLSNKLLVLIDGRSVYSPLYAGVFWDAQDLLLQDIERIEVISGPGGTLWGANAVNGVINIITRSSWETRGTLVDVAAGNEEAIVGLRHGFDIGDSGAGRAYLKYSGRDAAELPTGASGVDESRMTQAGFRLDWQRDEESSVTLQGDAYTAELDASLRGDFTLGTLPGPDMPGVVDISGANILARWERQLATDSSLRLQVYYDHTSRDIPASFDESRDTFDIDFQHHLPAWKRHNIVWGAGFRSTSDELDNSLFASFIPDERTSRTFSLFLEDEIGLWNDEFFLTVGAKLEHNDYTQFEFQPNLRAAWSVTPRQTLWAALSRAVRVPARLNTDLELTAPVDVPGLGIPLYVNVLGSDDYRSEELVAGELGYRVAVSRDLSFDLALFHNKYDHLQTQEPDGISAIGDPPEYLVIAAHLANGMKGSTHGGTLVANWQALQAWRLQFQYAYIGFDLELKPGFEDTSAVSVAGNSPRHQAAIHSYLELPGNFDLYTGIRHIDELPALGVPSRRVVDLGVGWQPVEPLRLSLTGRNLNDDAHLEFGGGSLIERSVLLRGIWHF